MPSIFELYEKFKDRLSDPVVISGDFMGWIERAIEDRLRNIWNTIVDPRDDELLRLKRSCHQKISYSSCVRTDGHSGKTLIPPTLHPGSWS